MNENQVLTSSYDVVFKEEAKQSEVFEYIREDISMVPRGYNCTVFAYGQTGSGKTYTMFGPNWDEQ